MLYEQWDTRLRFAVEGEVDGVEAGEVEFELLEGDDEIAGAEMGVARQDDFGWEINARHDGMAVGIHKIEMELMGAFILVAEGDAQGNGALRMNGRHLLGDNGVESAEEIEFTVFLGGGIAQDSDLDVHGGARYTAGVGLARNSLASICLEIANL